jgi:hypothetical protein
MLIRLPEWFCASTIFREIYRNIDKKCPLDGGAGGFDHFMPEFQINKGRKFLTTSWKG